ncbi:DUF6702 family protein [Maribacter sp. 2-571]|uniref:DUF6702 family protein n=1 Tax=Maribacter sp. 2-571 TaxID=3417569 RepID=UPI003D3341B9
MRTKHHNILLVVLALTFTTAFIAPHPIKLTSSLIEYDTKTRSLQMECRVFIDDFENSVRKKFKGEIDVADLSKNDQKIIEAYFRRYVTLMVNDLNLTLHYISSEVMEKQNVLSLKFSAEVKPLKKGDVFCMENRLFFEEFEFLQTNMTTIRIPPLISESYFEAKEDDYTLPIQF